MNTSCFPGTVCVRTISISPFAFPLNVKSAAVVSVSDFSATNRLPPTDTTADTVPPEPDFTPFIVTSVTSPPMEPVFNVMVLIPFFDEPNARPVFPAVKYWLEASTHPYVRFQTTPSAVQVSGADDWLYLLNTDLQASPVFGADVHVIVSALTWGGVKSLIHKELGVDVFSFVGCFYRLMIKEYVHRLSFGIHRNHRVTAKICYMELQGMPRCRKQDIINRRHRRKRPPKEGRNHQPFLPQNYIIFP